MPRIDERCALLSLSLGILLAVPAGATKSTAIGSALRHGVCVNRDWIRIRAIRPMSRGQWRPIRNTQP